MKSTYKKKKKDWSGTLRASFKAQGPLLSSAATCTCVCVCVYVWHGQCVYMFVCVWYICVHMHVYVQCVQCMFACVLAVWCACVHVCFCVQVYYVQHVCVCVYACMCPCVYNKGNQKIFFKNQLGWRYGSVGGSTDSSARGSEFKFSNRMMVHNHL